MCTWSDSLITTPNACHHSPAPPEGRRALGLKRRFASPRSRLLRLGILDETKANLEYVLALKPADLMERRLQTQVFKLGLAKSIHHARVLIRQRHIRVGKQIVNIPSFMVRTESQKHIDFAITSPYGGGRPGRNKRKAIAAKGGGGGGGDDEDME